MEIDVPVCGLMLAIDIRRLPFRGGFTWDASGHGTGVWSLEPGSWVICDILECMLPQGQHASRHIRKKKVYYILCQRYGFRGTYNHRERSVEPLSPT